MWSNFVLDWVTVFFVNFKTPFLLSPLHICSESAMSISCATLPIVDRGFLIVIIVLVFAHQLGTFQV